MRQYSITPWKNILTQVSKIGAPVWIIGMIVGAVIDGWSGLLAFGAGCLLVHGWFAFDIFVANAAERKSMGNVARALLAAYVIKTGIGFVILFAVPLPRIILNGWLLAGTITAVILWLGIGMRTIMRMRILYFDSSDLTNEQGSA